MLVVRLDSMGDVLLTGPAVRAVAATADSVTALVGRGRGDVARLLPGVDAVIEYEAPWVVFDPGPLSRPGVRRLVRRLRRRRFDGAVIFTSFHQSPLPVALLLRLAGVRWIAAASEDYPGSLLDLRHATPAGEPEAVRNLGLVEAAGFAAGQFGDRLAVRRPLPEVSAVTGTDPYVVFHPGAAVPARRPAAADSRRLVGELVAAGYRVLVTGSPAERSLTRFVAAGQAKDLAGRLDLPALAAVLDRAEVVVAPNTGPAHLAAAVGTPVVSLFAPVVAAQAWAPHGVPVVLLGDQAAPCRGSRARDCPVPGHPCLAIEGADLIAAVARLDPRPRRAPDTAVRREAS